MLKNITKTAIGCKCLETQENFAVKNPLKTRFAPSPTGYLHKGHVWSALCVASIAKAKNAAVHLRIENHDTSRCLNKYITSIKKDLEWLGFEWQTESIQSERHEIYEKYFKILQNKGLLYEFYKTNKPKIMFKNPEGSDFAIKDALEQWTYQFAVVVDDFEEAINLIIRGDDLKDSMENQVLLAKTIGRTEMPTFIHHTLIYDSNGKKLSKRDGSYGIYHARENNISPHKVLSEVCSLMLPNINIPKEISWKEALNLLEAYLNSRYIIAEL